MNQLSAKDLSMGKSLALVVQSTTSDPPLHETKRINPWVAQSATRGVSVDMLFSSPSARVDVHNAPEEQLVSISKQISINKSRNVL